MRACWSGWLILRLAVRGGLSAGTSVKTGFMERGRTVHDGAHIVAVQTAFRRSEARFWRGAGTARRPFKDTINTDLLLAFHGGKNGAPGAVATAAMAGGRRKL